MLKATRQLLYDWTTYRRNQRDLPELDAHLRSEQPTMLVHQMGRTGRVADSNAMPAVRHSHSPEESQVCKVRWGKAQALEATPSRVSA